MLLFLLLISTCYAASVLNIGPVPSNFQLAPGANKTLNFKCQASAYTGTYNQPVGATAYMWLYTNNVAAPVGANALIYMAGGIAQANSSDFVISSAGTYAYACALQNTLVGVRKSPNFIVTQ